jgi:murein L,D-transpeptidase YafK
MFHSFLNNNILLKTYKIALGGQPIGHKEFEGDNKTPEGKYFINDKNPNSAYHKNLGISYPNDNDLKHAAQFNKSAGGDIKIHGIKNGMGHIGDLHRNIDWTLGCIAITNEEIDELFQFVKIGSEIEIFP